MFKKSSTALQVTTLPFKCPSTSEKESTKISEQQKSKADSGLITQS
jgi:hypothetical protein